MENLTDVLEAPVVTNALEHIELTKEQFREFITAKVKEVGYYDNLKKTRADKRVEYVNKLMVDFEDTVNGLDKPNPTDYERAVKEKLSCKKTCRRLAEYIFDIIYRQTLRVFSTQPIGKNWVPFSEAVLMITAHQLGFISMTTEQVKWSAGMYNASTIYLMERFFDEYAFRKAHREHFGNVGDIQTIYNKHCKDTI